MVTSRRVLHLSGARLSCQPLAEEDAAGLFVDPLPL
jgi:hypothetical protein